MRWRARHWAAALAVSVAAHGLAALTFARVDEPVEIERSAGDPIAVSADNVMAAFQTEISELAPVASDATGEPVEAETVAAIAPDARADTVGEREPAHPVRPEQQAPRALTVSKAARAAALRLDEARDRENLAPVSDMASATPAEPESAQPTDRQVEPTRTVQPTEIRQAPAETAGRAEPVRAAAPVAPARNVETLSASTSTQRAEPVEQEREPVQAETVAIPPEKPERLVAASPQAAEPPRQATRPAARDRPRKEEKAKPRKRTASRKSGADRNSEASSGQAGSNARGRTARKAGDGGRSRGISGKAAMSNYLGRVVARLQRQKRYPSGAKGRVEGTAVVAFVINANGSVAGVRLSRSSGHSALDQAALAMVQRAAPFPPIPSGAGRSRIPISAPVRFTVR